MDAWWRSSPFTAVGIYVSGDSRACRTQPHLSPTWVATQVARGWRLLPIALGPQASCQPRFPRYQDDFRISPSAAGGYAVAAGQGAAEADKTAADAASYGIGAGSTLWYDLEGFDLANTHCRESALVFVSSWVTRIKQLGYVAGFYSSASSGIKMLDDARRLRPGQFALPDRIWIARWDGVADTSTTYIPEDGWRPGSRMKQYRGGHDETWGGVTINIDSNWLDLGRGSKPRTERRHCNGVRLSFARYPKLGVDASGSRVEALQCLLRRQGHYSGEINGIMTAATRTAVREMRQERGLGEAAVVGPRAWASLLSDGRSRLLKYGAAGERTRQLQRALNAAIGARLEVTGVYEALTTSAVTAYQHRVGARATGVVTARTWTQLRAGRR
jgi:peptidoglycan hydrolase-like protein with peptidoglycan-binding domain